MDRLRLGLLVLMLAPVAWIVGIFVEGSTDFLPHMTLLLVGLGFAAWAAPGGRRWLAAAGFAAAAVAIAWFYAWDLTSGQANQAGAVFVLGCLVTAAGAALLADKMLAVGLGIVALGSALWVYVDSSSDQWLVWQPGNLLAAVGAGIAAFHAWRGPQDGDDADLEPDA